VTASETGKAQLQDLPRSGLCVTAASPEMLRRAIFIFLEDRRITSRPGTLSLSLSISKGRVSHIIRSLGFSEICARWVPRSFTIEHKTETKAISSDVLTRFQTEGETFLSRILTADETLVHHFEPEWHHPQSPRKKKFKKYPSAGKVLITVFSGCEGAILVDAMLREEKANSDAYIRTLTELRK
jgi:hypothetical protein